MADGPYLLGIDFGTDGARVGIFDTEGTPLVFCEREYTLEHPRPGWAEHVWTSPDLVGVEVCAAAENCHALGAGFMEGILDREGESEARYRNYDYGAALFGQATRELGRFMKLLGGERETPYGLAGVGDMFVTSMGGRNVKVGRLVGSGLRFSEARGQMPEVALEGAAAIEVIGSALPKLTGRGIIEPEDFPLMRHLHSVVVLDEPLNMPWHTFFGGEPEYETGKG